MKKVVEIEKIKLNPNNPRVIKDAKFKKLVQSLKDFPEMADVRELVVNKDFMVLGGNMRLKAMKAAGWKEVPVRVVDWSEEKQKEFMIKDNASFGEWDWDILANQFEAPELEEWGLDLLPSWMEENEADSDKIESESNKNLTAIAIVAYDNINDLDRITQLYELDCIDMPDDVKSKIVMQRKMYVFK